MIKQFYLYLITVCALSVGLMPVSLYAETVDDYSQVPPFVSSGVPPLVMLTMARNHKLYYEAYNDITDLDGDAVIDIGYKGYHTDVDGNDHSAEAIDYYGYFDSYKCYEYDSSNARFNPTVVTSDKTCTGSDEWSGDFLNYVTMSRMDTLRKVLFGGYRSTDTTTTTVLERVFIPQDAHTWGKEYGADADYNIEDFTPLSQPSSGYYHLFANTSLGTNEPPVMRVMPGSDSRIWEWVSKERPVADDSLEDLTGSSGENYTGHPDNATEYEAFVMLYANSAHYQGDQAASQINGSGNPFGDDDYYLTIFDGAITIATAGDYTFAVNGDDAVELLIDGSVVVGWYGGHGSTGMSEAFSNYSATVSLTAGTHSIEFRHQETSGDDSYNLYWNGPDSGHANQLVPSSAFSELTQTVYDVYSAGTPASTITDYEVRVRVCDSSYPEDNCKQYPNGNYKPTGLLQTYGESEQMYFGLMTGSYTNNTSGGVLRKNVGSITDEIDLNTGQFDSSTNGIIATINKLKTVGFSYSSYSYNENCGWITDEPIEEGECRMWGNPIGEIMYETVRYFAGKGAATSEYGYGSGSSLDDNELDLPAPAWVDPYSTYPECAEPFMLVLSDPNNNFDSDSIPGSFDFESAASTGETHDSITGDLSGFDAESIADTISSYEAISGNYYIGQSDSEYDGAPTEKTVTSLGNIRGLSPEEPTKQGSFYPASIAYYARINDVNAASSDQKVITYAVALSSPLPRIEIDTDADEEVDITIVPFGKSVGGSGISATEGDFQPTNTIVDVFMQEQTPTYGRFRINFEDVEQGADHDMDAIAIYEYEVNSDGTLTINVTSEYAAGGIKQHMGYVISGTTADGTYLVVRDEDTAEGSDPDYFLDTPPGVNPGDSGDLWDDNTHLPLTSTRTFTASGDPAGILDNPLWYAAKWGGFEEKSGVTDVPDAISEWDEEPGSADGDPDTYFYVTNPLYLEEQLGQSFADILQRSSSGTAASVIASSRYGDGAIYQALFYTTQTDDLSNTVTWTGQTHALFIDSYSNMREDTNGNGLLDMAADYIIEFEEDYSSGSVETVVNKYEDANGDGELSTLESTAVVTSGDVEDINYLWNTSNWLNDLTNSDVLTNRGTYLTGIDKRYIMTFIDADGDMVADSGEFKPFISTDSTILRRIHGISPFDVTLLPEDLDDVRINYPSVYDAALSSYLDAQRGRVVNFVRGMDQDEVTVSSGGHSLTLDAMRSREFDYDSDGSADTWRLGDIVYSTPKVVGVPTADHDLTYNDTSYTAFYLRHKNRRQVVYVGSNDGMLHAFNGGFYSSSANGFYNKFEYSSSSFSNENTQLPLGAEMWAYVPQNLLPHLYWLTEEDYDTEQHVAYVDLEPVTFDAKIFTPESACSTDLYAEGCVHPNGWGTVLVVGMRLGGGALQIDSDGDNSRTDASGNAEETARSAFIIMDITDPEEPPVLLGEIAFDDLGYTTASPSYVFMKNRGDLDPAPSTVTNDWYLVLGSGPYDSSAGGPGGDALTYATSDQAAKVYMVDLKELVQSDTIQVLNSSGNAVTGSSIEAFAALDSFAFVSDSSAVDYDLDYRVDALYFGTVSGDFAAGWGGKLRRLVLDDDSDAQNWDADSVLIDLGSVSNGQPIVAQPAVSVSSSSSGYDRWVYFGTGRFFNRNDVSASTADDQQAYYGIKEPVDSFDDYTWGTVSNSDLLDTTNAVVYDGGDTITGLSVNIDGSGTTSDFTFAELEDQMANRDSSAGDVFAGWRFDLTGTRERNLGAASIYGDIVLFTSYMPDTDACEIEGESSLYGVYYTTGTAYSSSVFGLGTSTVYEDQDGDGVAETAVNNVLKSISLGSGMALSASMHTGQSSTGTAFLQTSTGAIIEVDVDAPGVVKSEPISWEVEDD